jgi:hypothetical protein
MGKLQPGDEVEVDNRGFLAAQTYHRHQVPTADFTAWDQFRTPDGTPMYPQRPVVLGPLFAAAAAGTVQTGRFDGKMILVECLLDREAFPWQADWYRSRVEEHLGSAADDRFRLWFVDNALHGDTSRQESPTHTTSYEVVDGQVVVPSDAIERRGVQPVVALTVHGDVFRAVAEVPNGGGAIVAVEWDLDGSGAFAVRSPVEASARVVAEHRHSFAAPGTYFVTVRVAAHRHGDATTPYARIQNLARVRVVVRD